MKIIAHIEGVPVEVSRAWNDHEALGLRYETVPPPSK
jgi:hypothetical protein